MTQPKTRDEDLPPWYLLARKELGVKEVAGAAAHPRVLEYLATTSLPATLRASDETAWCSAFVNWCVTKAGIKGTGLANARSWLGFGEQLMQPRVGCIAVFSRDSAGAASGHVAFYVGESIDLHGHHFVHVLGGNQSNSVCEALYPKSRLLGYRWPRITKLEPSPATRP